MNELETQILDVIQDGFPAVERPYAAIADILTQRLEGGVVANFSEGQVYEAVEKLRNAGIIRRIGGVYDSRRLGYTSRLCCGIVPEVACNAFEGVSPIEQFASAVNEIPSITHNYIRSHKYNVWFTVIGRSEQEIREVVSTLERRTALGDTHILNARKMFKINTVMHRKGASPEGGGAACRHRGGTSRKSPELDDFDRTRIRILSGDLPHSLTPFTDVAEMIGMERGKIVEPSRGLDDLLEGINSDLLSGRMRRFGAILRHQKAGFAENAMVCFNICCSENLPEGPSGVDDAGALLAEEPFVSHCYQRDSFKGFPYDVYAMVHAQSPEDLNAKIELLVKKMGNPGYAVLRSLRELKKTSFKFDI